jgi:hypothetical protein
MRPSLAFSLVASCVVSAGVTALVMLALLPAMVDAQVARTSALGLTVVRSDGLQGMTADVRPTGGGVLQVLGADGKTVRAQLAAGGAPPGQPPSSASAGLNVDDANGNMIARVGTLQGAAPIGIELWDSQGNVRYRATLDADGNPTIQLLDPDGNAIWSAP